MVQILAMSAVIVVVVVFVYVISRPLFTWLTKRRAISPQLAKNRAREKAFLEKILTNIRTDTDAWFLHDGSGGMGNLLANNDKNIGIVYQGTDNLTLLLNLNRLEEFQRHDADTVKLMMAGPHVSTFIKEAEQLIDKRGNELRFFADEFDRRL